MGKSIGERLVEQTILTVAREFTRDAAKKIKEVIKKGGKKAVSKVPGVKEVKEIDPENKEEI